MIEGAFLAVVFLASPQDQEWPFLQEVPAGHFKRFDELVLAMDWRAAFEMYDQACEKFAHQLARDPADPRRWVGYAEALRAKLAGAPGAAEAFQSHYDGTATAAFRAAREGEDWSALERAADRFFLCPEARESLDISAHRRFATGDVASAAFAWQRLLALLEPADALYPVVLCRLAAAYAILEDVSGLDRLRALAGTDRVRVGERDQTVSEYLASLSIDRTIELPAPEPTYTRPVIDPSVPVPPTTEVLVGMASLKSDAGQLTSGNNRTQLLYERRGDREYALVTTGRRVVALDPRRGNGKNLDPGVYWRYPEAAPIRGQTPVAVQFGAVFGLALVGDVLYATLLGDQAPAAVQRRQSFDGSTRVVAIDLREGRELWDTAKLQTTHRGKPVRVLEMFPFGDREFAFTSNPIPWEGRIYLVLCTHPIAERECYVLCLDAKTGMPLWSSFVAAGPPNKAGATLPSMSVGPGGVFVVSNFGIVAALDPDSGHPRWAAGYPSVHLVARPRQSSPPIPHGGRLYVLAQDSPELLCFDVLSGKRVEAAWDQKKEEMRIEWHPISYLCQVDRGWLVAGGAKTWILDLGTRKIHMLPYSSGTAQSSPSLTSSHLYLPYLRTGESEGVAVYDRRSWKLVGRYPWNPGPTSSEVRVAGDYLMVQQRDLKLFTSLAAVERRFAPHADLEPPRPEGCLQLARLLFESGVRARAIRAFERFLRAAEGDPARKAEVQEAKKKLEELRRRTP